MSKYSIKDLENLTGVKAHTIRIWERRYNLLSPERTDTNIRTYSDDHLKRLLNVTLMLGYGHKISKVSKLSDVEINQTIKEHLVSTEGAEREEQYIENSVNGLVVAMIELDEESFNHIFTTSLAKRGFEATILKVVYPFLEKVGVLWTIDELNPAQEHFISNLIRQKVIVASDKLKTPVHPKGTFVLYLPEEEMHELGLLLANYLLKENGYKTIYLGQNVPFRDLVKVVDICHPECLMTFSIIGGSDFDLYSYLKKLNKTFPQQEIYIAGGIQKVADKTIPSNIRLIQSITHFVEELD